MFVCYYNEIKRVIKRIWKNSPDLYSDEEVERVYLKLTSLDKSKEVQKKHIRDIYNAPNVCPHCGGELVVRTAKKGPSIGNQFYGCSNYPRCKYTQNI